MFLKAFGQKGQGSMTSKLTHKNVKSNAAQIGRNFRPNFFRKTF